MDSITHPAAQAQVGHEPSARRPANPPGVDEIAKIDAAFCDTFSVSDEAFAASIAFWTVPLADSATPGEQPA